MTDFTAIIMANYTITELQAAIEREADAAAMLLSQDLTTGDLSALPGYFRSILAKR